MKRSIRLIVSALAVGASLVTGTAFADAEPEAAPPSAETKLALRPSTPLALETPPSGTGAAWKLAAFAVIATAGLWVWKQRSRKVPGDELPQVQILRRTTIGVRSELVLVELEGQRVLIGVTPSSMQTLYLLPETPAEELAPVSMGSDMGRDRIADLLERRIPARQVVREPSPAVAVEDDNDCEGQAVGLRALGARR